MTMQKVLGAIQDLQCHAVTFPLVAQAWATHDTTGAPLDTRIVRIVRAIQRHGVTLDDLFYVWSMEPTRMKPATKPTPTRWGGGHPSPPPQRVLPPNAGWHMERAQTAAVSCRLNGVSVKGLVRAWRGGPPVPPWLGSLVQRARHRNVPLHYIIECLVDVDNMVAIREQRP